jgi:uncharacterized protein YjiS (DUF1127 family)
MSAPVSNIARPAVGRSSGTVTQLLSTCWNAATGHFVSRAAIATLRELDDRALRDIGLDRSDIEAAVYGLIITSDQARMS